MDPDREAATNATLVSLEAVARRTATALTEPPLARRAERELQGRVLSEQLIGARTTVEAQGQSDVVEVAFTDRSPRVAALVANTLAQQYIAFRREADRSKIAEAIELVEREVAALSPRALRGPEGRSLRQRGEQLQIMQSLQTGNAEIVQGARIPSSPTSPKPIRNGVVGGLLGLLLGLAFAIMLERLDRRLRDTADVESTFDRPVLGVIPAARRGRGGKRMHATVVEAYRLLRANLRYFNVSREIRSVLVTSSMPGDGKTTTAWHLAAVAAESGSHVLLIETDLRRPSMAQNFNVAPAPGLTTILATSASFDDVVQTVPIDIAAGNQSMKRTMDVLVSGPLPPNPYDLIESDALRELLSFAESRYDLVVVDTPPTSVVSDAIPLTKQVSGVIVVARMGHTTVDALTRLRDQLVNLDAPVLGVVVNGMRDASGTYGYGYGYGADYAPSDHAEFAMALAEGRPDGEGEEGDDAARNGSATPSEAPPKRRRLLRGSRSD